MGHLRTRHFRCASRAGTGARAPGVGVAAPDDPVADCRDRGRRDAHCGRDPPGVSAQAGRARDGVRRDLPAGRAGDLDWVGIRAGSDDVGGQCPGLRLLPCAARGHRPRLRGRRGGHHDVRSGRVGGEHPRRRGPGARRRGRSTPPGGRSTPPAGRPRCGAGSRARGATGRVAAGGDTSRTRGHPG